MGVGSKKRVANTAALRKAKADLDDLYRSLGFDPTKKPRVRSKGLWKPEDHDLPLHSPSDRIPGNGSKRTLQMEVQAGRESPETLRVVEARKKMVAPAFNKGPMMLVTRNEELRGSKRRD